MSKKRDERQILATGYYYHSGGKTYGKKTKSCVKAGYAETYAEKHARNILGLDAAEDTLPLEWRKTIDLLPQIREMIQNWLKKHKDKPKTKDIREARGLLRLYGELEHRFEKIELKIDHKIEEKRVTLQFADRKEEMKYWKEMEIIAKSRQDELIEVEDVESQTKEEPEEKREPTDKLEQQQADLLVEERKLEKLREKVKKLKDETAKEAKR